MERKVFWGGVELRFGQSQGRSRERGDSLPAIFFLWPPPTTLLKDLLPGVCARRRRSLGGALLLLLKRRPQHFLVAFPGKGWAHVAPKPAGDVDQDIRHGARVVERPHGGGCDARDGQGGAGLGGLIEPGL